MVLFADVGIVFVVNKLHDTDVTVNIIFFLILTVYCIMFVLGLGLFKHSFISAIKKRKYIAISMKQ